MTAVIDIENTSVTGSVLSGVMPFPLPQLQLQGLVHLAFPEFQSHLAGHITGFRSEISEGKIKVKVAITENVFAEVELIGDLENDGTYFHTREVFIQIIKDHEVAQAVFIASTLTAMLGLANEVALRIPDIKLDMKLRFEQSLLEISRKLQWRQLAYRLMVIEKATGLKFDLPANVSGDEIEIIAFIHRAIMEQSFAWPHDIFVLRLPANQEGLDDLSNLVQPDSLKFFNPRPISSLLFDKGVLLGQEEVTIHSRRIENLNEVLQEISCGDGHPVDVIIRPMDGQLHHSVPEAPRLPDNAWDSNIQSLIDLESQLDHRLAEGYHALAAATLEGLSEEEKAAVTASIDFGDEFVLNEATEE